AVLVGYNISFDIRFLNVVLERFSLEPIHNKTLELMNEAKRRNSFQANYKFETTLKEYGIDQTVLHRALEDAKLM
ncbi:3'-5' exonuclease, partial [Salmonella enterica]|uniref:3'-5' exonuclease n=1 Tax=Salmonella enterica TaxID=28901 RepID=UPI00329A278A